MNTEIKDEVSTESGNTANAMLPAVLFVGAKIYRTNYNDITDVITIERVTKTQAIAKNDTYRFAIEVSINGYVKKIGNTERYSTTSFYIETPKLKEKLWQQNAIRTLKNTDYTKLTVETLKSLMSVLNGR